MLIMLFHWRYCSEKTHENVQLVQWYLASSSISAQHQMRATREIQIGFGWEAPPETAQASLCSGRCRYSKLPKASSSWVWVNGEFPSLERKAMHLLWATCATVWSLSHWKRCSPVFRWERPVFQFILVASWSVTWPQQKEPSSFSFYFPHSYVCKQIRSSRFFSSAGWSVPAISWPFSVLIPVCPCLPCTGEPKNISHQCWAEEKDPLPLSFPLQCSS